MRQHLSDADRSDKILDGRHAPFRSVNCDAAPERPASAVPGVAHRDPQRSRPQARSAGALAGRWAGGLSGSADSLDEDASVVAARIWRLYYDLRDWLEQNERGRSNELHSEHRCLE